MSYMQNGPWTPSEKVNLLVNVLQSTYNDLPGFLLQIIHDHQVYPKWNDMPLPNGRSLHSSQIAFEEMSRLYRQQGRQLAQQQIPHHYAPAPNIAPAIPQQRQFHEPEVYHSQQRALQPRPPRSTDSPVPAVTNGELAPMMRPLAAEPAHELRKKRGRPSKEEAEERDRALAAEGKVYQPKKRPTKKFRASTGTPGPEASTSKENTPAVPLLQSPLIHSSDPAEATPSGSRRTEKPFTDDDDDNNEKVGTGTEAAGQDDPQVARSPSDRLLANHRERPVSPSVTPIQGPFTRHEETGRQ